jgi:hypothetical protein
VRNFLFALAAIVLVTIGAVAFIYKVTGDDEPRRAAKVEFVEAPPAPPPPPAEPRQVPANMDFRQPEVPPPPLVVSPAPPKPAPGTWGAVPAVPRTKGLGANAGPVGRGLAELAPALASCYGADVAKMDDSNEIPTLVLSLETRNGEIAVVDAAPMAGGGATDQLFACAIRVVKGRTFAAPGAKPGQRQRLIHPISP